MMVASLSPAVIDASNNAHIEYLKAIDPNYKQPVAAATGAAPPPPPSGGPSKKLLQPQYYTDSAYFFRNLPLKYASMNAVLKGAADNWGYEQWFNYFFAEAKAVGTDTESMGRVFSLLFDLTDLIEPTAGKLLAAKPSFKLPVRPAPSFYSLVAVEPAKIPLSVMTYLLNRGFSSVSSVNARLAKIPDTAAEAGQFGPYFDLKSAMNTPASDRVTRANYLLFYRGDSREPSQVIDHGGATCRADLADWRKSANIEALWHPWKDVTARSKMWLRKGNKDNDYYTVNSITMDFHISCAYPILRPKEFERGGSFAGHIVDWSDEDRAALRATKRANFCKMRNQKLGVDEFVLCDKMRVYVCVFPETTQLSPTYETGNNYPEAGVRNVPLEQILAYFEVERFHNNDALRASNNGGVRPRAYYESATPGNTMTILPRSWNWLSPSGGKNLLGIRDPSSLAQRFDAMINRPFEIDHSRLLELRDATLSCARIEYPSNVWKTVKPVDLVR